MSFLVDSGNLAFLDGYLYRVMVDMLKSEGAETSGLYDFYKARVEKVGSALSEYDRMLFDYVLANFDRQTRRFLHAGTGLGTLPSALAMAGCTVAGIEQDASRFRAASRVRATLADAWPNSTEHYELIAGVFPMVVADTPWMAPTTVLIFTNCGADWTEEFTNRVIASLRSVGDVLLDARLFGNIRDVPAERDNLIAQFEARGMTARPMAETPAGSFYYHLQHGNDDR